MKGMVKPPSLSLPDRVCTTNQSQQWSQAGICTGVTWLMRERFLNDFFEYGDGLHTTSTCIVQLHPFLDLLRENNPMVGGDPVRIVRWIHSRRIRSGYVVYVAFGCRIDWVIKIAQIPSRLQTTIGEYLHIPSSSSGDKYPRSVTLTSIFTLKLSASTVGIGGSFSYLGRGWSVILPPFS